MSLPLTNPCFSPLYVCVTQGRYWIYIRASNISCFLIINHVAFYFQVAERRIVELEVTRDLSKTWLHVDMDAFYAAVETLANPLLKGKPMAVGGMSMISTANYEVWAVDGQV